MADDDQKTRTIDEADYRALGPQRGTSPGVVGIFSQGQPINLPIPLGGQHLEIGRGATHGSTRLEDDRTSRKHTRIEWLDEGVRVTDLGSRNGTFLDGKRVQNEVISHLPRILRIGNTLFRFTLDIQPFLKGDTAVLEGRVIGPTLRTCYEEIARDAARGETLQLTGPSGAGKELAAQAFHKACKREGKFVAVNCAAIPAGLAEGLLFGARRGAHSGATVDTEGHIQAADRGTLFLDEIAELDASVQAKLLRVLQEHEVTPLGAPAPRKVDIRVCTATLKDLRAEVAAGRFRGDLYHRLGHQVRLPSLVERLEELPWLACAELRGIDPRLTPSLLFVEDCALRPWPGNVREFLRELRHAGYAALDAGRVIVDPADLSPSAGEDIGAEPRPTTPLGGSSDAIPGARSEAPLKTPPSSPSEARRDAIEAALQKEQGNVTRAARLLGVHRNQLRRWNAQLGIDPKAFGGSDGNDESSPPPKKK